jgi:hypothetical protein
MREKPITHNKKGILKMNETIKETIEGIDVSVETSLFEYGIAWVERDTEYHFIYKVSDSPMQFDWADISKDIDIKKEFDWADFNAVYSFTGMSESDFLEMPLTQQIFDLVSYYGYENVFGSCYGGIDLETICNTYGLDIEEAEF